MMDFLIMFMAIGNLFIAAGLLMVIIMAVLLGFDLITGSHKGRKVCRWIIGE